MIYLCKLIKRSDMKTLTPMKRYKTAIDNLRSQVSGYTHELTLNKAESKSIPWAFSRGDRYSTKGVECDFIMIFESLETKGLSFALTFTYMDKEQEDQLVRGSVKFGDDDHQVTYGEEMNLEKFKLSLNKLNKQLNELEFHKNFDEIIDAFSVEFLKKPFSIAAAVETAEQEINLFTNKKRAELELDVAEQTYQEAERISQQAKEAVNKALEATDAYQEREKLLARIARLDKIITNKKVLLEKDEDVKIKDQAVKSAEKVVKTKKQTLEKQLDTELNKYPKAIRNRIIDKEKK